MLAHTHTHTLMQSFTKCSVTVAAVVTVTVLGEAPVHIYKGWDEQVHHHLYLFPLGFQLEVGGGSFQNGQE